MTLSEHEPCNYMTEVLSLTGVKGCNLPTLACSIQIDIFGTIIKKHEDA